MNSWLYFLYLIANIPTSDSCKIKFYEAVTMDTSFNCFFIKTRLKDDSNRVFTALVTNRDLYFFYKETKKMDYDTYRIYIKKSLMQEDTITMVYYKNGLGLPLHYPVGKDKQVEKNAKKGEYYFFDYYITDDYGFILERTSREWKEIISQLWEWDIGVFSKFGYPYVHYRYKCK